MQSNNISFTSKIKFVDAKTLYQLRKGKRVDYYYDFSIIKNNDFYTEDVRTCSAGGIMNSKTGEVLGFHIFDNTKFADKIEKYIDVIFHKIKKPDRALLIGGKKLESAPDSMPRFQKIKEAFLERIKNVSIFEEHTYRLSQSDFQYNKDIDTWFICGEYIEPNTLMSRKEVDSEEKLKNFFKEIKLANGDSLYINDTKIRL